MWFIARVRQGGGLYSILGVTYSVMIFENCTQVSEITYIHTYIHTYIKHLMTGPKGNCFLCGQSLSILLYLPTQNRTIHRFLHGICRCFKGARPDYVWVKSSSCCFPRELVSFDPWHVTNSPPIGKHIWVGRYYKLYWLSPMGLFKDNNYPK